MIYFQIFCRSLFVIFLLAILVSILLRYTSADYSFGIFKTPSYLQIFGQIQLSLDRDFYLIYVFYICMTVPFKHFGMIKIEYMYDGRSLKSKKSVWM